MADNLLRDALCTLLVSADSLLDGQHPSGPDDVTAQVAADAARDVEPLLTPSRKGEPEWDALSDLADALRLAVAARVHGSAEGAERFQKLKDTARRARGFLDKI
jgi:hypothetical protein